MGNHFEPSSKEKVFVDIKRLKIYGWTSQEVILRVIYSRTKNILNPKAVKGNKNCFRVKHKLPLRMIFPFESGVSCENSKMPFNHLVSQKVIQYAKGPSGMKEKSKGAKQNVFELICDSMSAINSPSPLSQWTVRHLCAHFQKENKLETFTTWNRLNFRVYGCFSIRDNASEGKFVEQIFEVKDGVLKQTLPSEPAESAEAIRYQQVSSSPESEDNKIDFYSLYVQSLIAFRFWQTNAFKACFIIRINKFTAASLNGIPDERRKVENRNHFY